MKTGFEEIEIRISRDLDPVAAAADFAQRARAGLAADIASGRTPARYERFVDGRHGAPESAVRPGGTILYEFSYAAEIVIFALAFLEARSPSGAMPKSGPRLYRMPYRKSFYLGIDGKFIEPGTINPAHVPDGAELVIGNVQPYSRKVDVQLIGKRRMSFSTPPGLFADAAREIRKRFGNFVDCKAVYSMDFPKRYKLKVTQARAGTHGRVKRWAGEPVDSPAIIISPR